MLSASFRHLIFIVIFKKIQNTSFMFNAQILNVRSSLEGASVGDWLSHCFCLG